MNQTLLRCTEQCDNLPKAYCRGIKRPLKITKMGRNSSNDDPNGELSILLVVTVILGLLLMLSLLMCYACVLKRLCCGTSRERKQLAARNESYPMGDITLLSQSTKSERV